MFMQHEIVFSPKQMHLAVLIILHILFFSPKGIPEGIAVYDFILVGGGWDSSFAGRSA